VGIRLKLTIPIIVLWGILYGIFNFVWLPSYFEEDLQQYQGQQKQKISMLFSGLVDPLISADLGHVYATLQGTLNQEDWIAITVWDKLGLKLFPLEDKSYQTNPRLQIISYQLNYAGSLVANVELIADPRLWLSDQQKQINRLRLLFFGIFIVSVITSLLLEEKIVRTPIARLANAAKRLGKRDFSAELPRGNNDEIGQLISSFSLMRERLQNHQEELTFARDQALGATQAKSEFLAKMSHELRTPLNAIIGYGEMIKDDIDDGIKRNHSNDLGKIIDSAYHLLSLINNVLDLSKVEAGKIKLHIERVSLPKIIDEVVATIQPLAKANNNTVDIDGAENITFVLTDSQKLRQILFNLLSNACKFTHNGHIKIRSSLYQQNSSNHFKIDIIDNGIGISQQESGHLFKAFSQADNSFTRQYEGSGLGLHICSQLCQLMHGEINMSSQQKIGSTFFFWLPVDLQNTINDCEQISTAS